MIIVGVDPSVVATGVVVIDTDKPDGQWLDYLTTLSSKHRGVERVVDLGNLLHELITEYRPCAVLIEGYGFASNNLAPSVEIGFMYRYLCWHADVPLLVVPPTSLKQFVTGKGNAKKETVMREAFRLWQFVGTNDETDAFGLAMFGAAAFGLLVLPETHMRAVTRWADQHGQELQSIADRSD